MIRVRIELCPFGDESNPQEIGRMYIANDGKGTRERGNYRVAVCRKGSFEVPREIVPLDHLEPEDRRLFEQDHPKATRVGSVTDYPRLAYSVWRLITKALKSAFPEEK